MDNLALELARARVAELERVAREAAGSAGRARRPEAPALAIVVQVWPRPRILWLSADGVIHRPAA